MNILYLWYIKITVDRIVKVGKAPDALERVPEMMDTPPILQFVNVRV